MADNYRKCDVCGQFFRVGNGYKRIAVPAFKHYGGTIKNGISTLYSTPARIPVDLQPVDICGPCLAAVIDTLRSLSENKENNGN